jgi:hypothetical protein
MSGVWGGSKTGGGEDLKRHLLNVLAGVSVVLCVASAAIFVRSEFVPEGYVKIHFDLTAKQYTVVFLGWGNGRIVCGRTINGFPAAWNGLLSLPQFHLPADSAGYQKLSASPDAGKWLWLSLDKNDFGLGIHSLLIFFASLIISIIWMRGFIIARQAKRIGRCQICGYDLRATPERCPECGTMVQQA